MNSEYRHILGHCCCLIICILLLQKKLCSTTGCHCEKCYIHTEEIKFPKELQDGSDCLLKACVCCRIGKVYSTALKNTLQPGRQHKAKSNTNFDLLRYASVCMHRQKRKTLKAREKNMSIKRKLLQNSCKALQNLKSCAKEQSSYVLPRQS